MTANHRPHAADVEVGLPFRLQWYRGFEDWVKAAPVAIPLSIVCLLSGGIMWVNSVSDTASLLLACS